MSKQYFERITIPKEELEWLYVPDIEYCEYEGIKRKIQLIFPYKRVWEEDKKYPLVVFIPGAGWHRQEMYNSIPSYADIAKRGFVVAAVQVRESELATFPAAIIDVKKAIRFLYTLADQFHIDMNNIFLAGNSAGAHIALMAGLTAGYPEFDDDFENEHSCKVNGILSMYGSTNLFFSQGKGPIEDFLGTDNVNHVPELTRQASCGTYVTKDRDIPPVFLIHGTDDCISPTKHSQDLFEKLKEADKEAEYYEVEHEEHATASFWGPEVLDRMERFIRKHCV